MRDRFDIRSLALKALRIALVFSLVFWTSLGAELALVTASRAQAAIDLSGKQIVEFHVSEYTAPEGENPAVPDAEKQIRSIDDVISDKKQTIIPSIDTYGGSKEFAAYATVLNEDGSTEQLTVTELFDWTIPPNAPAELTVGDQTVTVRAKDSGEATVTCTLKPEYESALSPELAERLAGKAPALDFSLEIFGQVQPYIASVVILDAAGKQPESGRTLYIAADQAAQAYSLQALVTVYDPSAGTTQTYTCTGEQGLPQLTDNAFGELAWSVEEGSAATVDSHGALTLNGAERASVTCTAPSGPPDGQAPADTVEVIVGDAAEDDPQNPQDPQDPQDPGDDPSQGAEGGEGGEPGTGENPGTDQPQTGEEGGTDQPGGQEGEQSQQPATADDTGVLEVHLSYMPVPEGETACISSYISGVHGVTYITTWFESLDGGATWTQLNNTGNNTLKKPTKAPYLGRQYRTRVDIVSGQDKLKDPAQTSAYSPAVTLEVTKEPMGVILLVDYVPVGQDTLFTTVVWGTDTKSGSLDYTWEESADVGATWTQLDTGYLPVYSVLTETERLGHEFRVRITTAEGLTATSNTQMLAAQATEETPEETPSDPGAGSAEPGDSADSKKDDDSKQPEQSEQTAPAEQPKTLSETVDEQGSTPIMFNNKKSTMEPVGSIKMKDQESTEQAEDEKPQDTKKQDAKTADKKEKTAQKPQVNKAEITVDPQITEKVEQQKEAEQERVNATQPGARWNPIYLRNDEPQVSDVLFDNPLAYILFPLALACAAAGAVETVLAYRKQRKQPA